MALTGYAWPLPVHASALSSDFVVHPWCIPPEPPETPAAAEVSYNGCTSHRDQDRPDVQQFPVQSREARQAWHAAEMVRFSHFVDSGNRSTLHFAWAIRWCQSTNLPVVQPFLLDPLAETIAGMLEPRFLVISAFQEQFWPRRAQTKEPNMIAWEGNRKYESHTFLSHWHLKMLLVQKVIKVHYYYVSRYFFLSLAFFSEP